MGVYRGAHSWSSLRDAAAQRSNKADRNSRAPFGPQINALFSSLDETARDAALLRRHVEPQPRANNSRTIDATTLEVRREVRHRRRDTAGATILHDDEA